MMADFQEYVSGSVGPSQSGLSAAFDFAAACELMGLSRQEMLVCIPPATREIRSRLGMLRQAVRAEDMKAVVLNSHTIKSVSASLAVETVRRAAEILEENARAENREMCPALLEQLERLCADLLVELDKV